MRNSNSNVSTPNYFLLLLILDMSNNKKSTLINILQDIINSNSGYRPTPEDERWVPVHNKNYKIIKSSTNYRITPKLLEVMNKYTKIFKTLKLKDSMDLLKKHSDNIAIIYIIENENTDEKYVGYTTYPIFTFIKLNIHKFNNNEESVFEQLGEDDNLTNYSFEIIEYVDYKDRHDIVERKQAHKKLFDSDNFLYNRNPTPGVEEKIVGGLLKEEITKEPIDKVYEKRIPLFFELIKQQQDQFKPFIGYIYKIFNIRNKKEFIIGYHRELSKNDLIDMVENSSDKLKHDIQKFGRRNFDFELLETYHAKTLFDFLFRVDYYKVKNNTIDNGYNDNYNIDESNLLFGKSLLTRKKNQFIRNMFLRLQRYLFEKNLRDNTDYSDIYGIVYQIHNRKSKMRYIGYAHNSKLKHIVLDMYDIALIGNIKQNKMLKALGEEPYDSFNFSVVKIKKLDDNKVDIFGEAEKLIIKHNTVDQGYNVRTRSKGMIFGKKKSTRKKKTDKTPFWLAKN